MRRLTAHSERHHIADMTAAENMHMAAAGDTKITAVILVGQGETDPYAVRIRKDRIGIFLNETGAGIRMKIRRLRVVYCHCF